MSEKKRKKQKQRENAGILGASISTTAASSISSNKRKKRPPEPEDGHASELKESKPKKTKKKEKPMAHNHRKDQGETRGTDGGGDGAAEGGRRKRVTDPRFASVHTDPRFQRMPRRHTKIAIDSRFAGAFEDERFALSTAPVDKRGKARKGKRQNPLLHYYVQEEEVPSADGVGLGGSREDAVRDRLMSLPSDEDGESGTDRSDSVSTSSSSEDEDEDQDDDQLSVGSDVAHYLMGSHEDTPQTEEATHRLAVVNMDWDHIKAVDIYVVMRSCLPRSGHISSVAVYPSEFGLKCMEIEATRGPSALINGSQEQNDSDMEDSDADIDNERENEKLRSYELNRLRYYYAVVDCDSKTTANHLYEALDATELLKTSNVFDLRFIPDSMEFTCPPRDIATEAPSNYVEPDFQTRALQHSNVKLSWEEDEPKRKKVLRQKFNADQLDDLELKEFLASDDEDSDGDENSEILHDGETRLKKGEKYLALLRSAEGSDAEDQNDQDMEITFNTGLEDLAKRVLQKKDHKSETVWQAYLRRRKEKKKARKKNAKYSSDDDTESDSEYLRADGMDQDDDFFEEDTDADVQTRVGKEGKNVLSKAKRKESKREKQVKLEKDQEASQAELELLCASTDRPESPLKDDRARTGNAKKKGKKQPSENKLPKEDYHHDPRFSALFTSHLYALDPTDPQFKRSATYARQMVVKQRDNYGSAQSANLPEQSTHRPEKTYETIDAAQSNGDSPRKEKVEFLSMVRSLKRRTEALRNDKKLK